MSTLQRAIEIACSAHAGQLDERGFPYICHPMAVMRSFCVNTFREDLETIQIASLLHDVVGISDWTFRKLQDEGFSERVMCILHCLTKDVGERYSYYIKRITTDDLACYVKMADLQDDLLPERRSLSSVTKRRYRMALDIVTEAHCPTSDPFNKTLIDRMISELGDYDDCF